ncbi:MAG: zinc-ribbon domain-containing protein, partial [Desulfobacterales bacterium]
MIVTCNECDSSFNVDDHLLKDTGSKVRCSKCSSVFVVYPESAAPELDQGTEDLALEMDDELPDLEDMMDLDDEDLALDSPGDEDSDVLGLGPDEDDLLVMEESELGDLDTDGADLPDLAMDLDDLNEAVEADSPVAESADDALASGRDDDSDELDLSDLEELVGADDDMQLEGLVSDAAPDDDLEMDLDIESDELEPVAIEEAGAEDGGEQLDMEDFEDLVGADTDTLVEEAASGAADDLDLDLDLEPEPEPEIEPETASMAADLDTGAE